MIRKIRPRERDAIIQSLRSGVTPRAGIQYIQVGRINELKSIIHEIERVADKGSTFKFVVGDFGAGKSFFLQLTRSIAQEQGLVTMNADLAPDRRLQSTNGQALNLYQELIKNMATRAKADGNAFQSIVEKFITICRQKADTENKDCDDVIKESLLFLNDFVSGYDFAQVVRAYWKGFSTGDSELTNCAIKWFRGEYHTKTEANRDLKVRAIISDTTVYDYFKLLSAFVQAAGFKGLLITLDEMVNLYKIHNFKSREANYEQILRMLNDCLQGNVKGLGFILGGTPDFIEDPRKGLFSYEALRSRLATNSFAQALNLNDLSGPIMQLNSLTPEELYVLLHNLRNVFAYFDEDKYLVPDEALKQFLNHCYNTIGEAYFKTPRNTIKAFIDFLSVLEQNPELKWQDLINTVSINKDMDDGLSEDLNDDSAISLKSNEEDDELTSFNL
ncbi:MAG: ATP-binding protein [Succinivibrionaceae bacterium]|nr:ATP-binding protein [Succinivibrionaceae bacterium]